MIGVVSSTIYPDNGLHKRTWIPNEKRLEETQRTIASLLQVGITKIYLADNSGRDWVSGTENLLQPAAVYRFDQHQYQNKGISELWLLLSLLEHLPEDTPILKISGRYMLTKSIDFEASEIDVAAKISRVRFNEYYMSTRCYVVKNKRIYEQFLKRTMRELYGYSAKIVGPRSLLRIIHNSVRPKADDYPYEDPTLAIESAAARVLRKYNYRLHSLESLGLEGVLGGFENVTINE